MDRLLDTIAVGPDRIVVAGDRGLTLLDRQDLTPGDTSAWSAASG